MDFKLKIRCFLGGLLDECPRCGEAMTCAPEDREGHRAHLQACKADRAKAKAYKERLQEAEVRFGWAGWVVGRLVDGRGWLIHLGIHLLIRIPTSPPHAARTHTPPQKRAAERAAKQAAQEDMESLRTWEFLGGKQGDMWLLTDDQARAACVRV